MSNAAHKPSPVAGVSVCGQLRPLARFTPTQYARASASVCVCVNVCAAVMMCMCVTVFVSESVCRDAMYVCLYSAALMLCYVMS